MTGLWELTSANAKEFFRVRQEVMLALALPVFLMLILGLALSRVPDIGNITNEGLRLDVGVIAGGGPYDARFIAAIDHSAPLVLHETEETAGLERLMAGDFAALVLLPAAAGEPVGVRYNSTRTAYSRVVMNLLHEIAADLNADIQSAPLPLTLEISGVGGDDDFSNFVDFLIPGIVAMAVFPGVVFSLTPTLVTQRERGVLRRLKLTPVTMGTYALSHVIFRVGLGLLQMVLVLATGALVFHRPLHYLPGRLLLLSVFGSLTGSAIAFLLSTIARSQAAGVTLAQLTMLPMLFTCGAFFPLELMPSAAMPIINALPLTPLAAAFRGVLNFGWPVADIVPGLGILALYTVGGAVLTLRFFRWEPY